MQTLLAKDSDLHEAIQKGGRWMQRPPSEFCRPASACTLIPDSPARA